MADGGGGLAAAVAPCIPFVIGVSASLEVAPDLRPRLQSEFGNQIARLRESLPHTPLVALCSLANEAERELTSELAALGIPVCACLPTLEGVDPAALAQCAETRVVAPAELPVYLARYSHLVIAVTDAAGPQAQTAELIRLRLTGVGLLDPQARDAVVPTVPDVGPTVEITLGEGAHERHPARYRGDLWARRDHEAAKLRLDLFNADLTALPAKATSVDALMLATDGIANRLQRSTLRFLAFLYVCAFLAACAQLFGDEAIKLATLALAGGALVLARRNKLENRYQDYRAMCEALRVRAAWIYAGVAEPVEACYLRMHHSELQWIRLALRTIDFLYPPAAPAQPSAYAGACDAWLRGQWRYYVTAARREAAGQRILKRISVAVLVVGAVTTLAALGLQAASAHGLLAISPYALRMLRRFALDPVSVAAVIAALLTSYADKRAYEANAKRYERMFFVFDTARRRLGYVRRGLGDDPAGLVRDLGREALTEHCEWLLQRRERPLSIVQA